MVNPANSYNTGYQNNNPSFDLTAVTFSQRRASQVAREKLTSTFQKESDDGDSDYKDISSGDESSSDSSESFKKRTREESVNSAVRLGQVTKQLFPPRTSVQSTQYQEDSNAVTSTTTFPRKRTVSEAMEEGEDSREINDEDSDESLSDSGEQPLRKRVRKKGAEFKNRTKEFLWTVDRDQSIYNAIIKLGDAGIQVSAGKLRNELINMGFQNRVPIGMNVIKHKLACLRKAVQQTGNSIPEKVREILIEQKDSKSIKRTERASNVLNRPAAASVSQETKRKNIKFVWTKNILKDLENAILKLDELGVNPAPYILWQKLTKCASVELGVQEFGVPLTSRVVKHKLELFRENPTSSGYTLSKRAWAILRGETSEPTTNSRTESLAIQTSAKQEQPYPEESHTRTGGALEQLQEQEQQASNVSSELSAHFRISVQQTPMRVPEPNQGSYCQPEQPAPMTASWAHSEPQQPVQQVSMRTPQFYQRPYYQPEQPAPMTASWVHPEPQQPVQQVSMRAPQFYQRPYYQPEQPAPMTASGPHLGTQYQYVSQAPMMASWVHPGLQQPVSQAPIMASWVHPGSQQPVQQVSIAVPGSYQGFQPEQLAPMGASRTHQGSQQPVPQASGSSQAVEILQQLGQQDPNVDPTMVPWDGFEGNKLGDPWTTFNPNFI